MGGLKQRGVKAEDGAALATAAFHSASAPVAPAFAGRGGGRLRSAEARGVALEHRQRRSRGAAEVDTPEPAVGRRGAEPVVEVARVTAAPRCADLARLQRAALAIGVGPGRRRCGRSGSAAGLRRQLPAAAARVAAAGGGSGWVGGGRTPRQRHARGAEGAQQPSRRDGDVRQVLQVGAEDGAAAAEPARRGSRRRRPRDGRRSSRSSSTPSESRTRPPTTTRSPTSRRRSPAPSSAPA